MHSGNDDDRVARPAWVVLIGGYLIVHGAVFVLGMLFPLFPDKNLVGAIQYFRDEHGCSYWCS